MSIDTTAANGVVDHNNVRATTTLDEIQHIEDTWGKDPSTYPPGQAERYQRLRTSLSRQMDEMADHDAAVARRNEEIERIRDIARSNPGQVEPGSFRPLGETGRRRTDPWSAGSGDDVMRMDTPTGLAARARDAVEYAHGLSTASRAMLSEILDRDDLVTDAAYVVALSSDAYRSAFTKAMKDPRRGHLLWTEPEREAYARVEAVRAAMSLTNANGGYLMPLSLDPTVMLTNAGATHPIRQLARVEQTITRDWNGVVSAGVTAEWLAEGAEAADASPTFDRVTIPTFKGAAFLSGSYEVFQDTNALSQLPQLIADARERQEATAFATGNGTTAPQGIVTAVAADSGSTVTATTGTSFGIPDIYKVWDALTPRARASSKTAWLANNAYISAIRRFDQTGGTDLWVQLAGGTPPTLIGKPIFEASEMTAATTSGSRGLICGDFSEYIVVDRIGTTIVEVPMVMGGNNRPTYQAGLAAYYRVGAESVNTSAFRLLKT
jgi:HK97 family phage major capsid protein